MIKRKFVDRIVFEDWPGDTDISYAVNVTRVFLDKRGDFVHKTKLYVGKDSYERLQVASRFLVGVTLIKHTFMPGNIPPYDDFEPAFFKKDV